MSAHGWIGVDFDGTLAVYEGWVSEEHCGEPVPAMVERVKAFRAAGLEVRIFTARVFPLYHVIDLSTEFADTRQMHPRTQQAVRAAQAIQKWSLEHLGEVLPITCVKDYGMITLYDDRCVQVVPNTGLLVGLPQNHTGA